MTESTWKCNQAGKLFGSRIGNRYGQMEHNRKWSKFNRLEDNRFGAGKTWLVLYWMRLCDKKVAAVWWRFSLKNSFRFFIFIICRIDQFVSVLFHWDIFIMTKRNELKKVCEWKHSRVMCKLNDVLYFGCVGFKKFQKEFRKNIYKWGFFQ